MFGITSELMIIIGSALAAAVSFAAFVLPLLNRSEKKEHFKNTIEKKKKVLFQTAKEEMMGRGEKSSLSAKDSVATFFKVQQLAGDMGEKVRVQLLQAGIRDPMAPIFYIGAQIGLPILFVALSMIIMSSAGSDLSNAKQFMIILGALFSGFFLPRLMVKNTADKRMEELGYSFPDALDMMLICVQGGIGLEQTVERVAEEVAEHAPVLAEELGILSAEMAMLNDRRKALADFGRRVGGFGKSFATALIQAEQYGTSVSQAMRVMSTEMRDIRMANAEQKAAALPPKLTVPMILFFLPALFIIILGPAGLQAGGAGVGG